MKKEQEVKLIEYFNQALLGREVDYAFLSEKAIKVGYLIHPECATKAVEAFIDAQNIDYNSTFYKNWEDVISKTRFELFLDQIKHYASTYGTDFQGEAWVPNDKNREVPDINTMKVITPITPTQLFEKCMSIAASGIALKSETAQVIGEYIVEFGELSGVDIDSIKNREIMTIVCDGLNILPSELFNLLRYIIYQTTGDTMIIQNRELITKIQQSLHPFDFGKLNKKQMKSLASIFLRYKNVLLAFKHNEYVKNNKKHINKLKRLSATCHKPIKENFWNTVLAKPINAYAYRQNEDTLTAFKAVGLIQAINERLAGKGSVIIVRNGKLWYNTEEKNYSELMIDYYEGLRVFLMDTLQKRLAEHKCVVRFPKELRLTLPASEKTFFGNIPFGSSYQLIENNYVGIYWKSEWGTDDFDLHYVDMDGDTVGWNSSFTGKNITFSGDMTRAVPDAAEVFHIKKGIKDGLINVTRFRGEANSKFIMFFGQGEFDSHHKGYMVDPNTIVAKAEMVSHKRDSLCGIVQDNTITLCQLDISDKQVPGQQKFLVNMMKTKARSFIPLKEVLLASGYTDYDTLTDEEKKTAEYVDLRELNKDSIINLMR